ncbi:MAG: carboxypeptidase-like regulatory domain-containing protein [Planctomycetes bacterium]|nr:carboxypeptidase-like regulatory domain-containing protein [Planctomycetota bacterium]
MPSPREEVGSPESAHRAGPRSSLLRGRLVARDGDPPPADALVSIRTEDPEIDFPEVAARLGGREGLRGFLWSGGWDEWETEVAGLPRPLRGDAGPDGAFSIPVPSDLPRFRIAVESDFAFAEPSEQYTLNSPEVESGLVVAVSPAGRIEGSVKGWDGRPATDARVIFVWDPGNGYHRRIGRCDGAGAFVLRGLPPGRYEASAVGEGFAPLAKKPVSVAARKTARVDFVLDPPSSVTGQVVDREGKGISGARVRARPCDGNSHPFGNAPVVYGRATTDEKGFFRIGSLCPGEHSVSATSGGFAPSNPVYAEVPAAGALEGVKVVLEPGRTLRGTVVDREGNPVADAWVRTMTDRTQKPGDPSPRLTRESARTSSDGAFEIRGIDQGPFIVEASHPEHGLSVLRGIDPERSDLVLTLPGATGVAGRVLEAPGENPVRAFMVRVESIVKNGSWLGGYFDYPTRTFESEDGAFELPGLKRAQYTLLFAAPGFVEERVPDVEVKTGEITPGVEVLLRRAASIRGKVVEEGWGAPVPGAEVGWLRGEVEVNGEGPLGKAVSDADGFFMLPGVEPGKVRLGVTAEGLLATKAGPFEVRAGETLEGVALSVSRGGAVEGRAVSADGFSYAGAVVFVDGTDPPGNQGAEVGEDGSFRVSGVRAGRRGVMVLPPQMGRLDAMEQDKRTLRAFVQVEVGRTTRVEFPEPPRGVCTVRGRVLVGEEGMPETEVSLTLNWVRDSEEASALYGARWRTRTDATGAYRFERVPPGDATLHCSYRSLSHLLRVPEAPELVFDVHVPLGGIEGQVLRGSDGTPLVRANVSARRIGSVDWAWEGAQTDELGRYRIYYLAPGPYVVRAEPPYDLRPEEGNLAAETGRRVEVADRGFSVADFVLANGGSARVLVRDPEGKPLFNVPVRMVPAGSAPEIDPGRGGQTGRDGLARIAGLAPGTYLVEVFSPGYGVPPSEEKAVRVGEETEFRVDLVRGTTVRFRLIGPDGSRVNNPRVDLRDAQGRIVRPYHEMLPETDADAPVILGAVLCPGEYRLRASAPGCREKTVTLRVEAGATPEVAVEFEREEVAK